MKDSKISKIVLGFFCCLLLGGTLPYLFDAFSRKTAIVVLVLFVVSIIAAFKKGKVSITDWLILFMAGIPFHGMQIHFGSFFIRLTEVFAIPFLIWAVIQIRRNKQNLQDISKLSIEYRILIFFLAFSFMSTMVSQNILLSLSRMIILLYLITMSLLIGKLFNDKDKLHTVIKAMVLICTGASIYAIFQTFIPALQVFRPIPLMKFPLVTIFRSGVGWRNPNYYAFYAVQVVPVTFACLKLNLFKKKWVARACLIIQMVGLFCSYSRLGMIAISLSSLGVLWVKGRRLIVVVLLVVIIFLVVTAFLNMEYIYKNHPYLAASIFRIARYEVVSKNPLLIAGWRRDAWIANMRMFLDKPLLGVGPFMSLDMYSEYRPEDDVYPWEDLAVHNEYLSLLSERGFMGFLLFLSFLTVLTGRAIIYYKKNQETEYGILMFGLWASVMCFIWFAFGAATIYSVQFWSNVGLIFAISNSRDNTALERQA